MSRRLPNLNQLRAFEAAARHGSFKNAARELNVTHAAVSHQIKALEADLGFALFHRLPRKVTLTARGRLLFPGLSRAFDGISEAVALTDRGATEGEITVSVPPFFWDRILMPRLAGFHASHPRITVTAIPEAQHVDLRKAGYDAAIRYGDGDWPGLDAMRLHRTRLVPVAAATLIAGHTPPLTAAQIATLPLGALDGQEADWHDWLRQEGFDGPLPDLKTYAPGTRVVDFAFSGHCVALISTLIASEDVRLGRLVCLNPASLESARAMHLVVPSGSGRDPRVESFGRWLADELAAIRIDA